jgi:pimeloyl-ACP methyl ester carboxylesterase
MSLYHQIWFRLELVVQEPETSFAADVAATRRVLDKAGPCVLVGHSYGGMIITEAGMHPDIKALVYVAAVQPDVGESLSDLAAKMPPAAKSIGPVGRDDQRRSSVVHSSEVEQIISRGAGLDLHRRRWHRFHL